MEEKKETQAPEQPKQLSYEELRNIAGQLQQQNMQLRKALDEVNYTNMFKRLDYLFKVIEQAHMFPDEFVGKCSQEIIAAIAIPEETTDDKSDTEVSSEEE